MGANDMINIGMVGALGACSRGNCYQHACRASGRVNLLAVCDINQERLNDAAEQLGAPQQYTDYQTMLAKTDLDAVIISTPMPLHVPQAVAALKQNLHVLSEVPAGVSVDECRQLVQAANASKGTYMMGENFTYMKPNVLVGELVRQGLFGKVYYAEGEYLHELKQLNEQTPWRRKWQNGIDGITYGTHSLGPILQWMPDDRVVAVCCAGSGHHYDDPRGEPYAQDTSVMLCRLNSGGLVKIRVDMISDRPHSMANYQLQGTDGCYESARSETEKGRIWLRSRCRDNRDDWLDIESLEDEFLPDYWQQASQEAQDAGHGGGDFFEVMDWIRTITGEAPSPIGIHQAMDMTLPGLVSQQSIREGGRWIEVPDSRQW